MTPECEAPEREARSAGGRPEVGSGGGRPRPPPVKGVQGCPPPPREIFEILYHKRCIFMHFMRAKWQYFVFELLSQATIADASATLNEAEVGYYIQQQRFSAFVGKTSQ